MSHISKYKNVIDSQRVKFFFNSRATKCTDPLSAVMLQPAGSTLSEERNNHEKLNLLPKIKGPSKILELGCGAGRLASFYDNGCNIYLGLDFSEDLIARARGDRSLSDKVMFQIAEIPHIKKGDLQVQPPFDIFIITALLIYLNDQAVRDTLAFIASLASPNARIYIRESVSELDERLSLIEHFSDELGEEYSAIYRTTEELREIIERTLISEGFKFNVSGDYAFPPELRNRVETVQRYFTLYRALPSADSAG